MHPLSLSSCLNHLARTCLFTFDIKWPLQNRARACRLPGVFSTVNSRTIYHVTEAERAHTTNLNIFYFPYIHIHDKQFNLQTYKFVVRTKKLGYNFYNLITVLPGY